MRGLDTYRVRIQENGIGSSGVSELGEDHAVPLDPLAAERIEVVRGPATLRWGSQAIGGVVNATNNRIPDALPCPPQAQPRARLPGQGDRPAAMAGPCVKYETRGAVTAVDNGLDGAVMLDAGAGNFAFHADAFGRRADDYRIPRYPYLPPRDQTLPFNGRQPNSSMRADGQSVGGSYIFDGGFVGVAVSRNASLYRMPGLESTETNTRIDMDQTKVTSQGEYRPQATGIDAIRFWLGHTDYRHDELANEGGFDGVQQTFTNKEQEGRVEVQLTPFDLRFATLTTALGVQGMHQRLTAPGVEGGLFDPNRTTSVAGFMFNEFRFNETLADAGRRPHRGGRRVTGSVPDLLVDPLDQHRARPPLHAEERRHRLPPGSAVGPRRQRHRAICRARAARAGAALARRARGDRDLRHRQSEPQDRSRADRRGRACGAPRGPFRFEATAYYTGSRASSSAT